MLLNNKLCEYKYVLTLFLTATAQVNVIADTTQPCLDTKTQYIIGGQPILEDAAKLQKNSKCFISEVDNEVKSKTIKSLKIDRTIKLDRAISPVAIKVNLYDKKTVEDRNYILNAELRKATSLKEELSKKKSNGQSVDEAQLSRLDADITALKNELSR